MESHPGRGAAWSAAGFNGGPTPKRSHPPRRATRTGCRVPRTRCENPRYCEASLLAHGGPTRVRDASASIHRVSFNMQDQSTMPRPIRALLVDLTRPRLPSLARLPDTSGLRTGLGRSNPTLSRVRACEAARGTAERRAQSSGCSPRHLAASLRPRSSFRPFGTLREGSWGCR